MKLNLSIEYNINLTCAGLVEIPVNWTDTQSPNKIFYIRD